MAYQMTPSERRARALALNSNAKTAISINNT